MSSRQVVGDSDQSARHGEASRLILSRRFSNGAGVESPTQRVGLTAPPRETSTLPLVEVLFFARPQQMVHGDRLLVDHQPVAAIAPALPTPAAARGRAAGMQEERRRAAARPVLLARRDIGLVLVAGEDDLDAEPTHQLDSLDRALGHPLRVIARRRLQRLPVLGMSDCGLDK